MNVNELDLKQMSCDGEEALEEISIAFSCTEGRILCFYHHVMCQMKKFRSLGFMQTYKSVNYIEFKLEINFYFYSIFLEPDEVVVYCAKQEQIVLSVLASDSGKKLAVKKYFKYHKKQWQIKLLNLCNLYNRDNDTTNNLMETFNRYFSLKFGKKMDYYQCLTALQRIFAISSIIFRKLEFYFLNDKANYEKVFNKSKKNEIERKILLKKIKDEYRKLPKHQRTFDVQKQYIKNIYNIIKHNLDQLQEYEAEYNENNEIEEIVDSINVIEINTTLNLILKYKLSKYNSTNLSECVIKNPTDDNICSSFYDELKVSSFWKAIQEKWDLESKLCVPTILSNKLTEITEPLNETALMTAIGFQIENRKRIYPSLIGYIENPYILVFEPQNHSKIQFEILDINKLKLFAL